MNTLLQICVAIVIAMISLPLLAHNTMIMPGDGAIMTVVEPNKPLKLDNGAVSMGYGFSRYQGLMLCGYLGYSQVDVNDVTDKQWAAIQTSISLCKTAREKMYPGLREQLEQELRQARIAVQELPDDVTDDHPEYERVEHLEDLVYTLKFKKIYIQIFDSDTLFCHRYADKAVFQTVRPGLRYNETIFSREKTYRKHATYGQSLSTDALAYEWRACNRVKPVVLTNKTLFDGAFDADNPPAQVDGSSVCFVILVGPDPMPYAEGENPFGYYVVRPDGSIEAYALSGAKLPEADIANYPIRLSEKN
ncbi:MAG: hypothetical protein AB8C95_09910 [Phycisphaeraceae bacterium]